MYKQKVKKETQKLYLNPPQVQLFFINRNLF
jgi:hypothetical protein